MMFDTPQEAALKAENARLRGENEWLKRAVETQPGMVRPWGVEDAMTLPEMPPHITLPSVAGIKGKLMYDGRWSVVAKQERMDREKSLSIAYFTDGYYRRHIDDMTFVNHILPEMHERFIKTLADIFVKTKP